MADIYFQDFYQEAPDSCQPDITIPIFSGIDSATPETDGSISFTWGSITSSKPPLDVHVYIYPGTVNAATLFQDANISIHIPADKLQGRVFLLADQETYLVKGQQYTIGIRANDAFGYKDSNTALITVTAIASGNLASVFQTLFNQIESTSVDLTQSATSIDVSATVIANAASSITDIVNSINLTQRYQFDGEISIVQLEGEITQVNILNC